MIITIPTMGRVQEQITLRSIRDTKWADSTYLVCPAAEAPRHSWPNVLAVPDAVRGIAATRQWICDELRPADVCMASDDMYFYHRPLQGVQPGQPALPPAGPREVEAMFDRMRDWLVKGSVHVGVSARNGNHLEDSDERCVGRMMDLYAYNTGALRELGVRWDRLPVMEDFDVTLQLLRMGHANRIDFRHCWHQSGSNARGGCSTYRTPEVQEAGARGLVELHPGFVKLREAKAKNWAGFPGTRWDVTCFWRRAYDSAMAEQ